MADQPDYIVLKRDLQLEGRRNEIWVRRALLTLVLLIPLAAVLNAFGQRPQTSEKATGGATFKVYAPARLRSGVIYEAIGIPVNMFTVLFAVARTTGWIAQWREMIEDPQSKIGRPRQLYTGQTERPYVPIHARK